MTPAAIFVGDCVDDTATPPTPERNRLVMDLVLHYACAPFMSEAEQERSVSLPQPKCPAPPTALPSTSQSVLSAGDTNTHENSAPQTQTPPSNGFMHGVTIWDATLPSGSLFTWVASRLACADLADMHAFHDQHYLTYLKHREALTDVDERAVHTQCARHEPRETPAAAPPPSFTDTTPRPPLRRLMELIPSDSDAEYGLIGDAAPFEGMWRTIERTAAGTLAAARWLTSSLHTTKEADGNCGGNADAEDDQVCSGTDRFAAVHWFGGRHHAKRDAASGFCYVNDVVLGAMALHDGLRNRKDTPGHPPPHRILVVDLDAHHGDGTQQAFQYDRNYVTVSVHVHGVGVFPGTGGVEEVGKGQGRGTCLNVPLPEGATDELFVPLACDAVSCAVSRVGAELGAVVLVCGADGLQGDPLGRLNWTVAGVQRVVRHTLALAVKAKAKVMVLGGGGYVDTSTACLAAVITRDVLSCARAVQKGDTVDGDLFSASPDLSCVTVSVPVTCEYFTRYAPSFFINALPPACVVRCRRLSCSHPLLSRWEALTSAKESVPEEADDAS